MTLPQTTTILLACLILTATEATSEELAATKPQARLHHVWKQLDGERWSERHEATHSVQPVVFASDVSDLTIRNSPLLTDNTK